MQATVRLLGLLSLGLLAANVPAQRIITVGAGGNFSAIQPAVDAAVPGDVVLVSPGSYAPFRVDKGITVIGTGAVLTTSPHYPSIFVSGVPAGQSAVIRGGFSGIPFLDFSVSNNAGHVHGEGLPTRVFATNCASLTLRNMGTPGTAVPVTITDSNALIQECRLDVASGIQIERANVVIAESVIQGRGNILIPSPAVLLKSGTLTVAGAADTVLSASTDGSPMPAIDIVAGTLVLEPAVTLVPAGTQPPVRGGTVITRHVASMRVDVAGGVLTTRVHAAGALRAHTLVSVPLAGGVALPFGDLWLSPVHIVLDSGTVPPAGFRTMSVGLPAGLPPGLTIAVQALIAQPTGIELSTAAIVSL